MSTSTSLTLQERIARDVIAQRTAARHHAPRAVRVRRHVRAALVLRGLAERLDPVVVASAPAARVRTAPRPWSAAPRPAARRSPHRHS